LLAPLTGSGPVPRQGPTGMNKSAAWLGPGVQLAELREIAGNREVALCLNFLILLASTTLSRGNTILRING